MMRISIEHLRLDALKHNCSGAVEISPENHPFLMATSLPTPTTARVYVNLPEGMSDDL